jgi:nucleoside-diphosphate-sugar epimerase
LNVLLTGATGFVGQHVAEALLAKNHKITIIIRNIEKARSFSWFHKVEIIKCDLHKEDPAFIFNQKVKFDALIHLSWPGLPNYKNYFHIEVNYPADLHFLTHAARSGISQIMVAGTCFEYGLQNGEMKEDQETKPIIPYAFAKDSLRKSLEFLQQENYFILQWMRLFYVFGKGQNRNSLLAQLDTAISEKKDEFKMSSGKQIRDYLPIEKVADYFTLALENPQICGVINCCSGDPISVLDLVKNHIALKGSNIKLKTGHYPIATYEPISFWGSPGKIKSFKENIF